MKLLGLAAAAAVAWAGAVHANAFDDCVLKTMQGVTSDAAAQSIKEACLRKNSVALNDADLRDLKLLTGPGLGYGSYGMRNTTGFTVEVRNDTGFIVTDLTVGIVVGDGKPELFRVDRFLYQEPGIIYAGPVPDLTTIMRIDPGRSRKFQFEADHLDLGKKKWTWFIASAKGIVSQ
jgi:hypothetical protein